MQISKKIQSATAYLAKLEGTMNPQTLRNDAANIFADSYEEYMAIWEALKGVTE